MNTLGSYIKKHWATYTMAIVFMLFAIALDMLYPKITEVIVNEVIVARDFRRLSLFLLAILLIGVGRSIFGYFKEFTFDKNCITIGTEMRKDLFDHMLSSRFRHEAYRYCEDGLSIYYQRLLKECLFPNLSLRYRR